MNFLKNKFFVVVAVVVVVLVIIVFYSLFRNGNYETVEVERKDLKKTIEISGKVIPAEEVDLSFVASSSVTNVYKDVGDSVKVGDVLAEIDSSEVQSEVNEARANLLSAQAQLDKISGTVNSASQISLSKDNLIKTLNKAYVNADYIVRNNIDSFFEDANTINAEFILSIGSKGKILNDKREDVEKILNEWSVKNNSLTNNNVSSSDSLYVVNVIKEIDGFVALISSISSEFDPEGSVTQTQIDSYVSNLGTSRSTLATIIIDINTALNSLNDLQSDVPVQNANIQNSQASVNRAQAKASDYVLRAPFSGIITENNLEIGQVVSSSDTAFTLISNSPLEVETYIPEINIVGVDVGDQVELQFDALGKDILVNAVVSHIDPKETLKDGVVTYRTRIDLLVPNDDLRPGMSVNIEITKEVILNELIIPTYTLQRLEDGNFVETLEDGESKKTSVTLGAKDNKGEVIILSGLKEGDKIIVPNK
jgi:multidrug efflux pump subunit AcrA (membrane-fusion protein)